MDIYQAIILGIIQGLTEFLPVSSSGHLVIFQFLFGLTEPALSFDISVHIGTLMAVAVVFRKDIIALIISGTRFLKSFFQREAIDDKLKDDKDLKLLFFIIIGSVPTAIIGLLFHNIADQLFSSTKLVGIMLILTGTILWFAGRLRENSGKTAHLTITKALIIGVVQGLAVIPGISRSGSTIATGLFIGLSREASARYSFLLSMPAILGAAVLSFTGLPTVSTISYTVTLIGSFTSFIVGYFALRMLLYFVKKGRLHIFSPYCFLAGIVAITLG
jgi:undecaprenyl-diphosphatase